MSNRGEGAIGAILSVVALVAIGAFMYWLNLESREVEAEREAAAAAAIEAARDLHAGDLLADPAGAVGRDVVIDTIPVAAGLGQGALSIALSETVAYPVLLAPDAIQRLRMANITNLYGGDRVFLAGTVYTFNDSIRGVWVSEGAVNAGMEESIPMSPTFLLADSLVVH
ncbi:MAG: hypothetical protein R3195_16375 [Gemmatimonadota bacterium]|nr:hypothetical protein [Gemmatimonadota bacterium]